MLKALRDGAPEDVGISGNPAPHDQVIGTG
jgi:hypothetical protein